MRWSPVLAHRTLRGAVLCGLIALGGAGACLAQSPAAAAQAGPTWAQLPASRQAILAPLSRDWQSLDATGKQKWLEIAARYPAMPPEQQARMQERMAEWSRMTPAQRGQARVNFQQARTVPAPDRQAQWEAYKALPKERKDALARQAGNSASAAQAPAQTRTLRAAPLDAQAPKRNTVTAPSGPSPAPRSVAPTLVQSGPGATTRLVNESPRPPQHQTSGQPKIDVREATVDRRTLLPKRPAPVAAVASAAPASAPTSPP